MRQRRILAIALAMAVLELPAVAVAQAPPTTESPALRLGLGDFMTMLVQPRHLKLGLAGREHNWVYADYERHELEEAFERIAHYSPIWRKFPIAEMLKTTEEPMTALSQAIKARDVRQFDTAYARLTETCNACHQSAERGMIVVRQPDSSPFANQDFRPAK